MACGKGASWDKQGSSQVTASTFSCDTEALQIPELSRERRFVFSLESLKSVEKISAYELQLSFSNPKLEVFLSTRFVLASTRNRKLLANDWLEAFSTIHARKPSELVPREEHNALSSSLEKLMGP
ncbi:uncharacterized protein LOC135121798 isoform X1 [Zophobas morio]|uniref:uncharacterized protein LOC135121798 isoform X1 n=1 Tax=Zophobas morio TaxID=2755281 RepID=UPI0030827F70